MANNDEIKIPYPANIYVIDALRVAIKELENTVKQCGGLVHPETKITPKAKEYFERQGKEAEELIAQLHKTIQGIHP